MNELISIIVPVYNCEQYLTRCLDSLLSQTHTNLEIIVVDDGSTDQSLSICKDYSKNDERVKCFWQENKGVSAARNIGLDNANGDYIAFCDADDWAESTMCETLLSTLVNNDSDVSIVSCVIDKNDQTNRITKDSSTLLFDSKSALLEIFKARLFEGQVWGKLYKAELFKNIRFDEKITIFEDVLVLWKVFLKANKVVFSTKKLYHYIISNYRSALSKSFNDSYWTRRSACLILQKYSESDFQEAMPYVNKYLLVTDLIIIQKLVYGKLMNKEHRALLTGEIRSLYDYKTKPLIPIKLRIKILLVTRCYYLFALLVGFRHKTSLKKKPNHLYE